MSIIHEAMKKSGQPVIADNPKNSKPTEPARRTANRRGAPSSWRPLVVVAVLFLVAAPIFAGRILKDTSSGTGSRPLGQFAVEEAPLPASSGFFKPTGSRKTAPFTLSGVVVEGNDAYCLINGLVLRSGDQVGDATVEKITASAVTLNVSGQTVNLPVTSD